MEAIATAWYLDPNAGRLPAYLKSFETRSRGQLDICYRWQTERGSACGMLPRFNPQILIGYAASSPLFDSVAINLNARELFA